MSPLLPSPHTSCSSDTDILESESLVGVEESQSKGREVFATLYLADKRQKVLPVNPFVDRDDCSTKQPNIKMIRK